VCKAAISKDKVVPLYGRGGGQEDPRSKAPPRPAGQRTEAPEQSPGFQGFGFGDGGKHDKIIDSKMTEHFLQSGKF